MYVLGIKADLLTAIDIQRLVDNGIKETKSLDYKMNLSLSKDSEKKEFLNDITSFYNTDGGCLIFGIEEKKDEKGQNTGEPERIVGIQIDNKDKLFQQIEDLVRSNTDPAIAFIILHVVEVGVNNDKVLILGIPKGLGLPSMVTFNDTNRFYRRKNTGKYLVDIYELNDMFMKNQVLKDKALAYRNERIKKILNRESFPSLDITRFCVIHIIPFSFLDEKGVEISSAYNMNIGTLMLPMGKRSGATSLYNIDGYAAYDMNTHSGYMQIIRNGVIELYSTQVFFNQDIQGKTIDCISGEHSYKSIIESISDSLKTLRQFRLEEPFLVSIYFYNMKNLYFCLQDGSRRQINYPTISLPFITLTTYDSNLQLALKPLFDILWQCAGMAQCNYY